MGGGVDRRLEVGEAECHGRPLTGQWHEPEPHGGDDRERPLAARQEAGEVVTGVVLRQTTEVRHHRAVAEHGLEAGDLPAHRAVAHDVDATGVGRHHPADGAAVTRGEVDADGEARRPHVRLHVGQGRPRPHGDLAGSHVHVAERVEAPQADHDLPGERHAAADQPGVAALRHQGHADGGAHAHHGGDLRRVPGAHHGRGRAAEPAGPVDAVTGRHLRVGDDVVGAHDRAQVVEQRSGHTWHAASLPRHRSVAARAVSRVALRGATIAPCSCSIR